MKYDTSNPNADGSFPIVVDGNGTIVDFNANGYFRVSGLDGEDGNRKNTIDYATAAATVRVTSFSTKNLFVSNSEEDTTYTIALDQLSFIDGYTGKFCNVGKGNMIINTPNSMQFVGSCTTTTSITLLPQESIEIVCYNNGNEKQLIVLGKDITPAE
jgi:hypothetical protein